MSTKLFDPQTYDIQDLFKQIYSVPVYQRPYTWEKEQIQTFLEDLYESFAFDKTQCYYFGNILLHDNNEKINGNIVKYEIVDGQQRITTFALFLLSAYSILEQRKVEKSQHTFIEIKGSLWKFINREYNPDIKTLSLNSIEKEAFTALYNYCFDSTKNKFNPINFCENYPNKNPFEKRVFDNFKYIYNSLSNRFNTIDDLLDFCDYVLHNVQVIAIITSVSNRQVFSMFESINSKGVILEDIDKIKSYIFSNIDIQSHAYYLNIWGQLIIETNDQLYDYLYNFIRANVTFYRQNIHIINFKSLCKQEFTEYYHTDNLSDILKHFLDDLLNNVKYYKMLTDSKLIFKLIASNKFKFYYEIFSEIGYQHPKPLFLRTLIELEKNLDDRNFKKDVIDVWESTITFMLLSLTINGGDSKDLIGLFANVMSDIYLLGHVSKNNILKRINDEITRKGITSEMLKIKLTTTDLYSENKKLSEVILSLYESSKNENGKVKTSYDQAYLLLSKFKDVFSLDHLLVQTPKQEDEFKYRCDDETNTLVLLEGHDFPSQLATNGMNYDEFKQNCLNKIGNLRIWYRDKNSSRQNDSIALKEYSNFIAYSQVVTRGEDIANLVIDNVLIIPKYDVNGIEDIPQKDKEKSLPKFEELINAGILNVGDKLYITKSPENSVATIVDTKNVNFNGEIMSFYEWGLKVTKWSSICVYMFAAKVGEKETIHQKRIKYLETKEQFC